MLIRRTMEKAHSKLKPLPQISGYKFWIERELESCRLLCVSPEQLCKKYWESTSQPLDFSSLTENCQTTDAAVFVRMYWQKRSQKSAKRQVYELFKSTAFASYRMFLVQITTICFRKVHYMYIPAWIAREYRSWS